MAHGNILYNSNICRNDRLFEIANAAEDPVGYDVMCIRAALAIDMACFRHTLAK